MIITLPNFGEIDTTSVKDYYESDIALDARTTQLDLNFDSTSIDTKAILIVKDYLDNLSDIVDMARKKLAHDLDHGTDAMEFFEFHIDEIGKTELEKLVTEADKSLSFEKQLLSVLILRRIGFYPEEEHEFAVMDFTFVDDISNYLLVVKLNNGKGLDCITMES